MDLGIPSLEIKNLRESGPPKSRYLVCGLAVRSVLLSSRLNIFKRGSQTPESRLILCLNDILKGSKLRSLGSSFPTDMLKTDRAADPQSRNGRFWGFDPCRFLICQGEFLPDEGKSPDFLTREP